MQMSRAIPHFVSAPSKFRECIDAYQALHPSDFEAIRGLVNEENIDLSMLFRDAYPVVG